MDVNRSWMGLDRKQMSLDMPLMCVECWRIDVGERLMGMRVR